MLTNLPSVWLRATHLSLDDSRGYITVVESDLSACRKLRALEIDMLLRKSPSPGPNQLSVVCDIISRISNLNRIEKIRLTVYYGFSTSADFASLSHDHAWRRLQQQLNRILVGKPCSVELHIVYKNLLDCILECNYLPKPHPALEGDQLLEDQCQLASHSLAEKFHDHQGYAFVISHSIDRRIYNQ